MKVLTKSHEVKPIALEIWGKGASLGLVPTMGMFHQGHLSLIRRARDENDGVIISLFVNPMQFGAGEDYESYPRRLERDLEIAEKEMVDLVFHPTVEEIYPSQDRTMVEVRELSNILCGANRPGHFRGVATVVAKLLAICGPTRAYFGKKDYQQWVIIRRMVQDLRMEVEIVGCPTIRELDCLACSSRNSYLNPEERIRAPGLYRALECIRDLMEAGQGKSSILLKEGRKLLNEYNLREEYLTIVDSESLRSLDLVNESAVALGAVRCGKTRLIDNMELP